MLAEGADCVVTLGGLELNGRVVRIFPGSLYVSVKLDGCAPEVVRAANVTASDDLETLWSAKRGLYDLANRAGLAHVELCQLIHEATGKPTAEDLDFAEICRVQELVYTTRKGEITPF